MWKCVAFFWNDDNMTGDLCTFTFFSFGDKSVCVCVRSFVCNNVYVCRTTSVVLKQQQGLIEKKHTWNFPPKNVYRNKKEIITSSEKREKRLMKRVRYFYEVTFFPSFIEWEHDSVKAGFLCLVHILYYFGLCLFSKSYQLHLHILQ